ncbi:hypothetical protein N7G274_003201 [Stereocaulon virgatum]|uniref:Uncharacterized protein n=1 Tax=Stereocaulon virgatum TaxID=373712 RepID=A0ABR4AI22_9LECA
MKTPAFATYAEVQFQLITNLDNGPCPKANTYPNQDYTNVISKLNNHSYVITSGYVVTRYAQISYSKSSSTLAPMLIGHRIPSTTLLMVASSLMTLSAITVIQLLD